MVFCYSDIWLGNFILDDEGRITVVDFELASILPSSFSKFALADSRSKMNRDIGPMVVVPQAKDIDNTRALSAISCLVQVRAGFAKAGRKILGYYEMEEVDRVDKLVTDEHGQPVSAPAETSVTPESGPEPEPEPEPTVDYSVQRLPPPISPGWEQKWRQCIGEEPVT